MQEIIAIIMKGAIVLPFILLDIVLWFYAPFAAGVLLLFLIIMINNS